MEFALIGRLVQGSPFGLSDDDGKGGKRTIKNGANIGKPKMTNFIAIAIRKDDPQGMQQLNDFRVKQYTLARAAFPQMFDANGNCTHPRFAWKIKDGDGVDNNGTQNNTKPGWAGCWIVAMETSFVPKCFHYGKYDPAQQITDENVIKRGYYVRVIGNMRDNKPSEVPGLHVSHQMVELLFAGEIIETGLNAAEAAAKAGGVYMPPGASAAPTLPTGAPVLPNGNVGGLPPALGSAIAGAGTLPPMMGNVAPVAPNGSLPALPNGSGNAPTLGVPNGLPNAMGNASGGASAGAGTTTNAGAAFVANAAGVPTPGLSLPALGLPSQQPATPTYVMTASAQGTREQYHAHGYTDEQLINAGVMAVQ